MVTETTLTDIVDEIRFDISLKQWDRKLICRLRNSPLQIPDGVVDFLTRLDSSKWYILLYTFVLLIVFRGYTDFMWWTFYGGEVNGSGRELLKERFFQRPLFLPQSDGILSDFPLNSLYKRPDSPGFVNSTCFTFQLQSLNLRDLKRSWVRDPLKTLFVFS